MEEYTTEKITLDNQFNTQWTEAKAIYAESRINKTTVVDTKIDELKAMLTGPFAQLNAQVQESIADMQEEIQQIAQENDVTVPKKEDYAVTAEQMMQDSKHLFDQHRILLLIKVGIVLLILVKGNAVYAEYKKVFVGVSLVCIFVYLMILQFS